MVEKDKLTFHMKVMKIAESEVTILDKGTNRGFVMSLNNCNINDKVQNLTIKSIDPFKYVTGDIVSITLREPDQKTLKEILDAEEKDKIKDDE